MSCHLVACLTAQSGCLTSTGGIPDALPQCITINEAPLPKAGCEDFMSYAPLIPEHTNTKTILLVFHVFRKDDGTQNFQNIPSHIGYIDQVISGVNALYSSLDPQNTGAQGNCNDPNWTYDYLPDARIRVARYPTIFFHNDSDGFAPGGSTMAAADGGCNTFERYVRNNPNMPTNLKTNALHVFLFGCWDTPCNTCNPCRDASGAPVGIGGLASGIPAHDKKFVATWRWYYQLVERMNPNAMSEIQWNLAHEVAHCAGLFHTFDLDDLCCDTNMGNSSTGNNLMTYANGHALSECQIARMHYFLDGRLPNISDMYKTVVTNYCALDIVPPITIRNGEKVVWNSNKRLNTNVVVETGGELIIKCTVGMPAEGTFTVRPGGRMIIDGGHITYNGRLAPVVCAAGNWNGIFVEGNKNGHTPAMQSLSYQPKASDPGILLAFDARIESANVAAASFNPYGGSFPNWSPGGLIFAQRTLFQNNTMGASFFPMSGDNHSAFDNCQFIPEPSSSDARGIGMSGTQGIKITNCEFRQMPLWGIGAWNASFTVLSCQFKNNNHGIDAFSLVPLLHPIEIGTTDETIKENTFANNLVGIYTGAVSDLLVTNNIFDGNEFAMSANGPSGFRFSLNSMTSGNGVGIDLVNTTYILPCFSTCNDYRVFTGMDISGNNNNFQFNDETFDTSYDLVLANEQTTQGSLVDQGKIGEARWSLFSEVGNFLHIDTRGNTRPFSYHYPDLALTYPRLRPKCSLNLPNNCLVVPQNFYNEETNGGNRQCIILSESGDTIITSTLPLLDLDAYNAAVSALQKQIVAGDSSTITLNALQTLQRERGARLWELVCEHWNQGDLGAAEALLRSERTVQTSRHLFGFLLRTGRWEEAVAQLALLPDNETDDVYFKSVQQINLLKLQEGPMFRLSPSQETLLVSVAASGQPAAAFAQALLSELKFYVFQPKLSGETTERIQIQQDVTEETVFRVTPNPSRGLATLWLPQEEADGHAHIAVFDAQGRCIRSWDTIRTASLPLDLTGLPTGLYLVRMTGASGCQYQTKYVHIH